jgi:hypothetical protein
MQLAVLERMQANLTVTLGELRSELLGLLAQVRVVWRKRERL